MRAPLREGPSAALGWFGLTVASVESKEGVIAGQALEAPDSAPILIVSVAAVGVHALQGTSEGIVVPAPLRPAMRKF